MNKNDGTKIDCLVIPIEMNDIYLGKENKSAYLNLVHFPLRNAPNEYGHTHTVKQSFNTEQLQKMTEEEKNNLPFLGSSKDFSQTSGKPIENKPPQNNTSDIFEGKQDDDDDLPF